MAPGTPSPTHQTSRTRERTNKRVWTFRAVATVISTAAAFGCGDPTGATDSAARNTATASFAQCDSRVTRGRTLGSISVTRPLEMRLNIGDTARLASVGADVDGVVIPVVPDWKIEDTNIARVDSGLVLPLSGGQTRLTANVAGRALCVLLTTVSVGPTFTAVTIDNDAPIASTDAALRMQATVHYSNGIAVPVHDAAQWISLDPQIAAVETGAWVTPKQIGSARIVARVGTKADTANMLVTDEQFASLAPRRAEDFASSIGVNIHLSYFDRVYGSGFQSIIVPRLRELGVRHVRDGGTVLPDNAWMNDVYSRWRILTDETGARFTIIMSARRTASGPGTNYSDMSHVYELRDRIGAERIEAFEGLNEHDQSGRPDFASDVRASQRALYNVVKGDVSLSSRFAVLGPSFANVATVGQVGDLSGYMDQGVIHPYDGGQIPTTNLRANTDAIKGVSGSKPIQATEVGYHTASNSTNPWHWALNENAQAKYTLREFLELYNAGVRRSFAYELIDEGTDLSDMEQNFGLLRNDGSRKPAFESLRNLIAVLGDRDAQAFSLHPIRVRMSGDTAGVRKMVLEKSNGRRYLVLWLNTLSYDKVGRRDVNATAQSVTLSFADLIAQANIFVPFTRAEAIASFQGVRSVQVAVADHPTIIELKQ